MKPSKWCGDCECCYTSLYHSLIPSPLQQMVTASPVKILYLQVSSAVDDSQYSLRNSWSEFSVTYVMIQYLLIVSPVSALYVSPITNSSPVLWMNLMFMSWSFLLTDILINTIHILIHCSPYQCNRRWEQVKATITKPMGRRTNAVLPPWLENGSGEGFKGALPLWH